MVSSRFTRISIKLSFNLVGIAGLRASIFLVSIFSAMTSPSAMTLVVRFRLATFKFGDGQFLGITFGNTHHPFEQYVKRIIRLPLCDDEIGRLVFIDLVFQCTEKLFFFLGKPSKERKFVNQFKGLFIIHFGGPWVKGQVSL